MNNNSLHNSLKKPRLNDESTKPATQTVTADAADLRVKSTEPNPSTTGYSSELPEDNPTSKLNKDVNVHSLYIETLHKDIFLREITTEEELKTLQAEQWLEEPLETKRELDILLCSKFIEDSFFARPLSLLHYYSISKYRFIILESTEVTEYITNLESPDQPDSLLPPAEPCMLVFRSRNRNQTSEEFLEDVNKCVQELIEQSRQKSLEESAFDPYDPRSISNIAGWASQMQ